MFGGCFHRERPQLVCSAHLHGKCTSQDPVTVAKSAGIMVLHIVGGEIVEEWNETDMPRLLREPGLLPARQQK
jgi:hypothetical protein